MPLTQFNRLVLPAPLGPTRAKISPVATRKLTPPSTTSPPKASRTSSTVRSGPAGSAMPAALATVRLDVAVTARLAALAHAQVELADVGVLEQAGGGVLVHDAATLHHIPVVGDLQGGRGVLLHEQDGEPELGA